MDTKWQEIKEQFRIGVFVFLFFFALTFFLRPIDDKHELNEKKHTLAYRPAFKASAGKGKNYWIELYFKEEEAKYKISGIDYKYMDYTKFKSEVDAGDTVTILTKDKEIYALSKNGYEYLNFEVAQIHKHKNKLFFRILWVTGLVVCAIALLFKRQPSICISGKRYKVSFGWLLMICLLIAFLLLVKFVGYKYASGEQFVE
ncbi:hypothetical protein [Flavisolibacter tropicus]|uniref:DUF3592 domain-containing protein n=1 Tax=Flavisolibacter tropicus TaxID=1492898 RepID=A0A172U0M6_9BACT|nr:hypothetical protein [Flavisolibacter tropicus]ANE52547.1 hypothetical protein SY85_20765 [Flavisolibacter tropicus]